MKRPLEDQIRRYTQAIDGMAPPVEELMPESMREATGSPVQDGYTTTISLSPTPRRRMPAWAFAAIAAAFILILATPLLLSLDNPNGFQEVPPGPVTSEPSVSTPQVVLEVESAHMVGFGFAPGEVLDFAVNGVSVPGGIPTDGNGEFNFELTSAGLELADGDVVTLTHSGGSWERIVPIVTFDTYDTSTGLGSGTAPSLDSIDTIAVRIRNADGDEFESTRFDVLTEGDGTWNAIFEPLGPGEQMTDSWAIISDAGFEFARSFGVIPESTPDETGSESDPVLNPDNGHYYQAFYVPAGSTWEEAMLAAQEWFFQGVQGHLVTITSAAESDFVTETFPEATSSTADSNPYWLGAFQPEGAVAADADWQWVTGEPFEYSNWDPVEPNDVDGKEQCIHFTHGMEYRGMWNDQPCDDRSVRGFIVEFDF